MKKGHKYTRRAAEYANYTRIQHKLVWFFIQYTLPNVLYVGGERDSGPDTAEGDYYGSERDEQVEDGRRAHRQMVFLHISEEIDRVWNLFRDEKEWEHFDEPKTRQVSQPNSQQVDGEEQNNQEWKFSRLHELFEDNGTIDDDAPFKHFVYVEGEEEAIQHEVDEDEEVNRVVHEQSIAQLRETVL